MTESRAALDLQTALRTFMTALQNFAEAQDHLLLGLLRANENTIYGKKFEFKKMKNRKDYQNGVPVVTYEELRPYVEQMLAGEQNVLFAQRCEFFAKTSGTTAKPKLIGFPEDLHSEYFGFIGPMLQALERHHPGAIENGFCLTGKCIEETSATGTPVGQASGFVRRIFKDYPFFNCAPEEVFEEENYEIRYFLLAYSALIKPLRALGSLNPSTLLTLFKNIEKFRDPLVRSLRTGRFAYGPPGVEKYLRIYQNSSQPRVQAADLLERAFNGQGKFLANAMWPQLEVVSTWQGGATKYYLNNLRDYCPKATLWPMVSGSSEAALLTPLAPNSTGGVPAVLSTYFEFIAEDGDPQRGPYLQIHELEKDQTYRMLITNSRGLYRLAMEDIFKVDGHHENVPTLSYLHRIGNTSSLTGEKMAEKDITSGLNKAQELTQVRVVGFHVAPEWQDPPHYVLMIETGEKTYTQGELQKFIKAFEDGLCQANTEYEAKRRSGRLGTAVLCVLEDGEFDRMKKLKATALGRSDIQLKIPVLTKDLVDLKNLRIKLKI